MNLFPCISNPIYENGLLSSISVGLRPTNSQTSDSSSQPPDLMVVPFSVSLSFVKADDGRIDLLSNMDFTVTVKDSSVFTITLNDEHKYNATVAKHGVDILVTYGVDQYSVISIKNPINEMAKVVSADGRLESRNDNQQITLPIIHLSRQPVKDDFKDFENCLCFIDEFPYLNVSPVPVFLRRQTQFTWNIYVDTANTWSIVEKPNWLVLDVDSKPAMAGDEYSYDKVMGMSVDDIPEPGMYNDYVLIRNLTTGKDVYVPVLLDVDVPLTVNEASDVVDLEIITQKDITDGASFELRIRRDRYWQIIGLDTLLFGNSQPVCTMGRENGYHSTITKLTINPNYDVDGEKDYSFYVVSDTYRVLVRFKIKWESSIVAFPTGIIWLNQADAINAENDGAGVANLQISNGENWYPGTSYYPEPGSILAETQITGNIRNNCPWLSKQGSIINGGSIFMDATNVAKNENNLNRMNAWTQRVVFCTKNHTWDGIVPTYNCDGWDQDCFSVTNVTELTLSELENLGYANKVKLSLDNDGSYDLLNEDGLKIAGCKIWVFDVKFDPDKVDGFISTADNPKRIAGISRGCSMNGIWAVSSNNDNENNQSPTLDFCFNKNGAEMKFPIYVGYYIPSWYKITGYTEFPNDPSWIGGVLNWQEKFDEYHGTDNATGTKLPYYKDVRELARDEDDSYRVPDVDESTDVTLNMYSCIGEGKNYSSTIKIRSNFLEDSGDSEIEFEYNTDTIDTALYVKEEFARPEQHSIKPQYDGGSIYFDYDSRIRCRYDEKIPSTNSWIIPNSNLCKITINLETISTEAINVDAHFHRQHFLRGWSVNLLPDAHYIKHVKVHVNTWGDLAAEVAVAANTNEQPFDSNATASKQKLLNSTFNLLYSDQGAIDGYDSAWDINPNTNQVYGIEYKHHREVEPNCPTGVESFRLHDHLLGAKCGSLLYASHSDNFGVDYRYLFDRHNSYENVIKEQGYFGPGMFRVYSQNLTSTIPADVDNFIGERTLTLIKYIYVRGYDEVNLLLPDKSDSQAALSDSGANAILSTYDFPLASKDTWETIVRDMKHPLWSRINVANNELLNAGNYNDRNNGKYVTYKFTKPVTLRGMMSLFYVQEGKSNTVSDVVSTWFVEGRINGHLNNHIPKTDWFPITQFSHCPYNDEQIPYVVNRPFTFPPVLVDEVRVFGCSPNNLSNKYDVSVLLPVIYWFEYCPLLNPYMGTARTNHAGGVTQHVSNASALGILDGYGSGESIQPHQMVVVVSNTSRFDERQEWGDIADGFIENAPTNNKALQTTAADDFNLGFNYPLLSTQIVDLIEWQDALDNNEDYLSNFNVTDVQPPLAGDIRVKLVPFRNYGNSAWIVPEIDESGLTTQHRSNRSPYPFFEEIEMKGIMYMPMIRKEHGFSLAYLKISPYAHKDSNYALSQDGYRFFIAQCGTNDNFADFKQNPYRSASGDFDTHWHRRISASTANDTIGYVGNNDSYPDANKRWSCITCGNVLGEFSLNETTPSGAITVSQLFGAGNENADKQVNRLLDDYVKHIKSALTLIDDKHVTIYMRSGSLNWRFLFRRDINGKWTNYGRTAVIADQNSLTIADNLMAEVNVRPSGITASGGIGFDGCSAYDIWVQERGNTTPSQLFTYHEQFGELFLWAYQRAYSNENPTRFIITDTTTIPWTVKRVEDFTWEFLDSYHRTIDRDKSKGLFFVLSGRALNNMYSRSTNRYTFGEFQMFHKKPPCGDFYPVAASSTSPQYIMNGKNSDNVNSKKLYDTLDVATTNDIYTSRNSWTGYAPLPWAEGDLATMYPVATVYFGTNYYAMSWSNTTLYTTLKDRAGVVLGGTGNGATANAFTQRRHNWTLTEQSSAYLEFDQAAHSNVYPDTLAVVTSDASAEVKKWLPCRGWEYPIYTNITLMQ